MKARSIPLKFMKSMKEMRGKKLKMVFALWLLGVACTALLLVLSESSQSSVLQMNGAQHRVLRQGPAKKREVGRSHERLLAEEKPQSLLSPKPHDGTLSRLRYELLSDGERNYNDSQGSARDTFGRHSDQYKEISAGENNQVNTPQFPVTTRTFNLYTPVGNASFHEMYPDVTFREEEFDLEHFRMPLPRTEPRSGRQVRNLDPSIPRVMPVMRPRNVSRTESPHYPWGSHAFGPLQAYTRSPLGTKWNAYFYDQTIAVVLEDSERTLLNCTLLEVIPQHEQRAALKSLGQVMALVPLTFRQMVQLSYYCKTTREMLVSKPPSRRTITEKPFTPDQFWRHASSLFSGILPGTVWCGLGDRARVYSDLGDRRELDLCCRGHDHCPVKLRASTSRYGITNTAFSTVSHCLCDEAFRMCLEKASTYDEMASVVGELFFNIIRPQCLARPKPNPPIPPREPTAPPVSAPRDPKFEADHEVYKPRLDCLAIDGQNGCRLWTYNPKHIPLKLKIITPNFRYNAPDRRKL